MNQDYEITVIVCTYNPDLQKLISTLKSVVLQKGVKIQVIVTDDGSSNNYFNEVKINYTFWW